jgi:hypothetical protein
VARSPRLHVRPRAQEGEATGLRAADDRLEEKRRGIAFVLLDEAAIGEDRRELVVEDTAVKRD